MTQASPESAPEPIKPIAASRSIYNIKNIKCKTKYTTNQLDFIKLQPAILKRKMRQRDFQSNLAKAKRSKENNRLMPVTSPALAIADPAGLMLGSKQVVPKTAHIGASANPMQRAQLDANTLAAYRSLHNELAEGEIRALVDSGSSVTVFRNKQVFKHLHRTQMKCADISGNVHHAQGVGDVEVIVQSNKGPTKILLTGCLLIPSFQADIISCSRLRDFEGYGFNLPPQAAGYMYLPNGTKVTFERPSDRLEYMTFQMPDPTL